MTVSDNLVNFFVKKGVNHFFGYQGTMIAFFVDAIHRNIKASNHSCYNEQGAAFAACGYAQASGSCGVAYATSGPGAINLLSGVANAYFDSEPVVFITGQINTNEYLNIPGIRQQGFQEVDIVKMALPITKYAVQIKSVEQSRYELEKAWSIANSGRKGPVLIDIPMNLQRAEVDWDSLPCFENSSVVNESDAKYSCDYANVYRLIRESKRPVFLVGNGVARSSYAHLREFVELNDIPVATSLMAKSFLPDGHRLNLGFIGGSYGCRAANMIAGCKCDLLVCLGVSLGSRQVGTRRKEFAPNAKILRVDIDRSQLKNKLKDSECIIEMDVNEFVLGLKLERVSDENERWLKFASEVINYFKEFDNHTPERYPNRIVTNIRNKLADDCTIVSDVGQHMMWVAQSSSSKTQQRVFFSGGHGAMGYSLPAAIGAYYATQRPVACFAGDGAFQMNIQELQWVRRENIPVTIVTLNNHCLGMIRAVEDDYIGSRYEGTMTGCNYDSPSFAKIAEAYGIESRHISAMSEEIGALSDDKPLLIEVEMNDRTLALPKTFFGEPIYNQRPYIDRGVYERWLAE